jgi:DNA-damage-inducible protein J
MPQYELQCNSYYLEIIMAANQLVQVRIDGAIKKEAAAVLEAMGLSVSDAVRLLLTKIAREHALPFDPLIPNNTTISAIMEARAGNLPSARSIKELKEALYAND